MRTALLITPLCQDIPDYEDADYIGVDAGALRILEAGRPLAFAVGDFDSMDPSDYKKIADAYTIYKHPIMKDETDSELALRLCREKGYEHIIFWNALGGRLDHSLVNILLAVYRYRKLELLDRNHRVTCMDTGRYQLDDSYPHLSFFAMEPSKITLEGFLYPLDHAQLNKEDLFAVSNTLTASQGIVTIHSGCVLCVQSKCR